MKAGVNITQIYGLPKGGNFPSENQARSESGDPRLILAP